jgi:hypothetical protein
MKPTELHPAPPEVMAVVARLIEAHYPHLKTARLVVAVRETAQPVDDEEGKATIAATGVDPDAANGFEYLVWFAMDAWQLLDEQGREAVVYHELTHCGRDEQGRPALKEHDASVFNEEIELYGVWWTSAQEHFAALS